MTSHNPNSEGWSESDSRLYQTLAPVAVPARQEQLAALLTLLPFSPADSFRAVELGCGEGILSYALLDCFPQAELIALDGSAAMRALAKARLEPFGARGSVNHFNLAAPDWLLQVKGADCIFSSLCLHHLDRTQKQILFKSLHEKLTSSGVLLIADLVAPQRPEARQLFAATWDRAAKSQSLVETGSTDLFDLFVETEWNYYQFDDPADKPSPLFDQLLWLKEAGFAVVDCFWLQAGHAIYGGYKEQSTPNSGVSFETARQAVDKALATRKHKRGQFDVVSKAKIEPEGVT
jgi:tRNA (cmo5U34)-methyltransferase